ncbi:MAG TPA: hydrolase [Ruminococcaceae bacterium]|mgnify:CR=1 FL=1|jgi:altronate dehydratase|nr:hydrolase [Oscillospiraceae bacterium]HCA30586.1 hydrolase [Oscillospiraceae bacterium]
MNVNALLMHPNDNVVTCIVEIDAGQTVTYVNGNTICTLQAHENIPYCHKIALSDLSEGDDVMKYGESIGKISQPIKQGHWVYHKNLFSVPRDYDSEMI